MAVLEGMWIIICFHLSFGNGVPKICTPLEWLICNFTSPECLFNQSCHTDLGNTIKQPSTLCSFQCDPECQTHHSEERGSVNATCVHNLPQTNLSIRWLKNNNPEEADHTETLQIPNIEKDTDITCNISSICGTFHDTVKITIKDEDELVIILICVGAAFGVLLIFAIVMKIIQKSGQVQRNIRNRQREQNIQNIHSSSTTVSSYW